MLINGGFAFDIQRGNSIMRPRTRSNSNKTARMSVISGGATKMKARFSPLTRRPPKSATVRNQSGRTMNLTKAPFREELSFNYGLLHGLLSYFRVRRTFNGLTSLQVRSIPCSSSVLSSAALCICKFGSSTMSGPFEAAIARLIVSRPCLNKT